MGRHNNPMDLNEYETEDDESSGSSDSETEDSHEEGDSDESVEEEDEGEGIDVVIEQEYHPPVEGHLYEGQVLNVIDFLQEIPNHMDNIALLPAKEESASLDNFNGSSVGDLSDDDISLNMPDVDDTSDDEQLIYQKDLNNVIMQMSGYQEDDIEADLSQGSIPPPIQLKPEDTYTPYTEFSNFEGPDLDPYRCNNYRHCQNCKRRNDPFNFESRKKIGKCSNDDDINNTAATDTSPKNNSTLSTDTADNVTLDTAPNKYSKKTKFLIAMSAFVFGFLFQIAFYWLNITSHYFTISNPNNNFSFFPNQEYVTEFTDGSLGLENDLLLKSEIAITYYYSPRCRNSLLGRDAYQNTAKLFRRYENVKFYAINCQREDGDCFKQFGFYKFPIIHYATHLHPTISFNEEITEVNLFKWMTYLLKPFVRVNSIEDVMVHLRTHRVLVLSHFPVPHKKLFEEFVSNAASMGQLRSIVSQFKFLITTNSSVVSYLKQNNQIPTVMLLSKNVEGPTTMVSTYHYNYNDSQTTLLNWLSAEYLKVKDVSVSITSGSEQSFLFSNVLYDALNASNAVVLFTEGNSVTHQNTQVMHLFKMIATDYHNLCSSKYPGFEETFDKRNYINECFDEPLSKEKIMDCCSVLKSQPDYCTKHEQLISESSEHCLQFDKQFGSSEVKKICCQRSQNIINKLTRKNIEKETLCEYVKKFSKKFVDSKKVSTEEGESIVLECVKDEKIVFLIMDQRYLKFLGNKFDVRYKTNEDRVVLFSNTNEALYTNWNKKINKQTIFEMITKFRDNDRNDIILKEQPPFVYTESRNVGERSSLKKLNRIKLIDVMRNKAHPFDAVIYYYDNAFAMSLTHILHSLQLFFQPHQDLIQFFMVDVSQTSVPDNYKCTKYPAIYYESRNESSVSRMYPSNLPITVSNLIAFVMARCPIQLKWKIALDGCKKECIVKNKKRIDNFNAWITDFIQDINSIHHEPVHDYLQTLKERKMTEEKITSELRGFLESLENDVDLHNHQLILKWVLNNTEV